MDIVILANFCGDFSRGDNGRFLYLAKMLSSEHEVEIITSDFLHARKEHRTELEQHEGIRITKLHECGYQRNICLRRFASHYMWGKNVRKYLRQRKTPDVIYAAVPSLTGPLAAAKYCEKKGTRFVIDVQDLWPEAFKMVFRMPVISDFIFLPFVWMANGIYRRADAVCAVSRTYVERALQANKKCAAGANVFLGTDLGDFDAAAQSGSGAQKMPGETWLGYCGTLGASYDLTCVFDALVLLQEQGRVLPRFIVMGSGPRQEEFEQYAKKKGLDVCFTGRLPYNQMCQLLCMCDMVVNPITKGAAQSIINKHADYAACGLPVLSTQECEEYRTLVEDYRMGFNCECGSAEDLAEKLYKLIQSPELAQKMGRSARRCAEEKFDRAQTYLELVKQIIGK